MRSRFEILVTSLFVSAVLLMTGCQTTTGYYLGAGADAEEVISIAAARSEAQRWQDLYLTIDSRLEERGQGLLLTGQLSYSNHPQMMYTLVRNLRLRVFLLDADNRVVSYQTAYEVIMGRPDETYRLSVPVDEGGAVTYTFGYEVSFIDDEGSGFHTWNLPRTGP